MKRIAPLLKCTHLAFTVLSQAAHIEHIEHIEHIDLKVMVIK